MESPPSSRTPQGGVFFPPGGGNTQRGSISKDGLTCNPAGGGGSNLPWKWDGILHPVSSTSLLTIFVSFLPVYSSRSRRGYHQGGASFRLIEGWEREDPTRLI